MSSDTRETTHPVRTAVWLTTFVLLVVGGPYAFLISNACEPSGFGEFVADVIAWHSLAGC